MSIFQMFWFTNGNWSRSSKKSITITGQCSKEDNPIIKHVNYFINQQTSSTSAQDTLLFTVYGIWDTNLPYLTQLTEDPTKCNTTLNNTYT